MYSARSIRSNCREEILGLEIVRHLFQFLPISCEENTSGPRPIANTDNITLDIWRPIISRCKGLVISPVTIGRVG